MAPKITRQPASVSLHQGQALSLSVMAEGYPAPTYQWRRNGAHLQGATSAQFSIPAIQPADTGRYEVVVSNRVGHVTSQTAVVSLLSSSLPSVTREPVNVTVGLGDTASFSVVVAGSPAPTYQWRKDGAVVRGATGAILTLYQVQPSDEGAYDVLISNLRGTVLSRAATLRVLVPTPTNLPPRIATPPASVALAAGDRTVLAVAATGDGLSYQWRRNGVPLPGANAPTLELTAARAPRHGLLFRGGLRGRRADRVRTGHRDRGQPRHRQHPRQPVVPRAGARRRRIDGGVHLAIGGGAPAAGARGWSGLGPVRRERVPRRSNAGPRGPGPTGGFVVEP
jgi:hypothetical protein